MNGTGTDLLYWRDVLVSVLFGYLLLAPELSSCLERNRCCGTIIENRDELQSAVHLTSTMNSRLNRNYESCKTDETPKRHRFNRTDNLNITQIPWSKMYKSFYRDLCAPRNSSPDTRRLLAVYCDCVPQSQPRPRSAVRDRGSLLNPSKTSPEVFFFLFLRL